MSELNDFMLARMKSNIVVAIAWVPFIMAIYAWLSAELIPGVGMLLLSYLMMGVYHAREVDGRCRAVVNMVPRISIDFEAIEEQEEQLREAGEFGGETA